MVRQTAQLAMLIGILALSIMVSGGHVKPLAGAVDEVPIGDGEEFPQYYGTPIYGRDGRTIVAWKCSGTCKLGAYCCTVIPHP